MPVHDRWYMYRSVGAAFCGDFCTGGAGRLAIFSFVKRGRLVVLCGRTWAFIFTFYLPPPLIVGQAPSFPQLRAPFALLYA